MTLWRTPILAFVLSRVLVLIIGYVSLVLFPTRAGQEFWRASPDNIVFDGWAKWDSAWYRDIAINGYSNSSDKESGQKNLPFWPGFPMVLGAAYAVFGGNIFYLAVLMNHLFFFIALLALYEVLRKRLELKIADRTLYLLAFFPFSFFYSAVYSESLYLMCASLAFMWGERRQWLLAACAAGLASGVRLVGVSVFCTLVVLYLESIDYDFRKIRANALLLALGLAGTIGYPIYLQLTFGDPLLFYFTQFAKGFGGSIGWHDLYHSWRDFLTPGRFLDGNYHFMNVVHSTIVICSLALTGWAWRRIPKPYLVYLVVTIIPCIKMWSNFGRYAAVIFPLFIALAYLTDNEKIAKVWSVASTTALVLFTIAFTHFYWVA